MEERRTMELPFKTRILRLTTRRIRETAEILREKASLDPSMRCAAETIVLDVKRRGDPALRRWSRRLDGVNPQKLLATRREIRLASAKVPPKQIEALRFAAQQLRTRALRDLKLLEPYTYLRKGVRIDRVFVPLRSVGCYVPGGSAVYPSSLVMSVVPAKIAGVSRIVVCCPPLPDGTVSPLVAAASEVCEVDEVYKVGGAQAIAAMAYGTESIQPVDKIVGPGGPYVLAAKQFVSNDVGIDLPAGPTELLILAFGRFRAEFVARDLVAQAEHSPLSICGVITDSGRNARNIASVLSTLVDKVPRTEIAKEALERNSFVCITRNRKDAAEFANAFAPEHVHLMGSAEEISNEIRTCGIVLVGDYSSSALSDYSAGSNHVLPTGGLARSQSGLSVWDFVRRMEVVSCSRKGFRGIAWAATSLARAEGLDNHALAVLERLRN